MICFNTNSKNIKVSIFAVFIATIVFGAEYGVALAQTSDFPISLAPPQDLVVPEKSLAPKKSRPTQTVEPFGLLQAPTPAPMPKTLGPAQRIFNKIRPNPDFQIPSVKRPSLRGISVEVDTLKLIDPDAVGVLEIEQGGFGGNMWQGISRATVIRLLPHLPVNTTSWAMRDLMRRLLLSASSVPEGVGDGSSLVGLRIKLLMAMGDLTGVEELLNVTPNRDAIFILARIETEARLLSNDNARACQLTASHIGKRNDPYWQKVFIFCQALAGESERASLGVDLLRETDDTDKVFFSLINSLITSSTVKIDSLPQPTPLQLAMARVVKARLPADVISSNELSILRIIATSPNAEITLRLEAAERAESAGALPVDMLRQLYTSVSFSEEDLAKPLSNAEAESGPLSRALLYRTSLVQKVPAAQAEALEKAFVLAREGGEYASAVRVFLPILKRIPATEDLLWFAPEAARASLISQDPDVAKAWFDLMRTSAVVNPESKEKLTVLLPTARIAASSEADEWTPDVLKVWRASIGKDEQAAEKVVLLYSLIDILGDPIPEEDWEGLIMGAQRSTIAMPRPEIWYRLASAAGQQQIGATVMLSLLTLGEGGPAGANPVVLRHVLSSLRTAGLETEARALALESALAAGL